MKKLAVLVSGSGTNLQAIINAIKNGSIKDTRVTVVISNKKDAHALVRAEKEGIKNLFLNPKDFLNNTEYDKKLLEIINSHQVDLIVMGGYLRILTDVILNAYSNKIINIHPALLPDFGGKGMYGKRIHEAVLKSGKKESGCTVHFATCDVDLGPIIGQKKVPILPNDTPETLANRIHPEEHKLLVESINRVLFEKVTV